jgi:predicted Zn-dependent protease
MTIQKKTLEQALSSFSGDYREVFVEYTRGIQLRLLNGKLESPFVNENKGYSFLSRTGKEEYFSASAGNDDITENAEKFAKIYGLHGDEKTISLE